MAKNAGACGELEDENPRKTAAAKIFETARELFYRRGVRAVGVDEIVCEAGVTKPSLYRAFKSKDDLVAACLEESAREGQEAIQLTLAAAGSDPMDRLKALVRHYAEKLNRPDFRGCPISNVAVELPEPAHPGRAVLAQCKAELRGIFVRSTREAGAADPEALADGLILVIEGAIATHHVFGSQGPAHAMIATCDALIAAHIGQRSHAGLASAAPA
jgi:AcrR family transcriptional regulator